MFSSGDFDSFSLKSAEGGFYDEMIPPVTAGSFHD